MSGAGRLVVATRILNEEDIVEAFARHHARLADALLFLDNGSTDRTLPILTALRDEGLPVVVVQNLSVHFFEAQHNSFLLHMAVGAQGADWVLHLDADEFIDLRRTGGDLRARLAAVPEHVDGVKVALVNYHPSEHDDARELLIPARIGHRFPAPADVWKVMVRGRLNAQRPRIDAGNHEVILGDRALDLPRLTDLLLAHYPQRSGPHLIAKSILGRLKVLASGEAAEARRFNDHYTPFLERIRDDPAQLLGHPSLMANRIEGMGLVHDPAPYLGAPLRHTQPGDPLHRALRSLAAGAERLARAHGRLLDTNQAVRTQVDAWASDFDRVV